MIILTLILLFYGLGIVLLAIVIRSLARGAPFVRSSRPKVEAMVAFADVRPGERAADLGSGDGRLVMALARAGAEAHGFEHNPLLVWWARRNIRKAGLADCAFVHWKDFWRADLSGFDIVTVFGISHIMRRLEKKLIRELKPNGRVVSNAFQFPTWPPARHEEGIYLYRH